MLLNGLRAIVGALLALGEAGLFKLGGAKQVLTQLRKNVSLYMPTALHHRLASLVSGSYVEPGFVSPLLAKRVCLARRGRKRAHMALHRQRGLAAKAGPCLACSESPLCLLSMMDRPGR
jgi:hypothetical protein